MTSYSSSLSALPSWSRAIAISNADDRGMVLDERHLQILHIARDFFDTYGFSPSMRPLCKTVMAAMELDKSPSLYLNQLFPGSPAKLIAQLAGLPKPKNCI